MFSQMHEIARFVNRDDKATPPYSSDDSLICKSSQLRYFSIFPALIFTLELQQENICIKIISTELKTINNLSRQW